MFQILKELKQQGTSMLIIEQNLMKALGVADRGYVMETGRMVLEGSSAELLHDPNVLKAYLGRRLRATPAERENGAVHSLGRVLGKSPERGSSCANALGERHHFQKRATGPAWSLLPASLSIQ